MFRVVAAAACVVLGLWCLQADAGARGGLSDRTFYVRTLGSRCLDFGGQASWAVGSPVFVYGCNGTVAQQVRVTELDATHDVELRVQSLYCIGVRGGTVAVGRPLELQRCDGSPAQRFALDGDSILMGSQTSVQARGLSASASLRVTRDFVVEPEGDSTVERTPLVVGTRDLSDAEYFRFQAVDGSGAPPTTGFVRVATEAALDRALSLGWGTVIEVDDRRPLTITGTVPKEIHAGVTLRGYRKFIDQGPLIVHPRSAAFAAGDHAVFDVSEDHVRITGLRLQGPTRDDDTSVPKVSGIEIHDGPQLTDVTVDHVDASDWTDGAVNVLGSIVPADPTQCLSTLKYPRPTPVRIVRNFIHHDVGGSGYGVVTGNGAFVLVEGNVEYMNKHSIAADGAGTTGYVALDNLVLARSPGGPYTSDQSFDSHGSLHPGNWYGGTAGDVFDIGWNTFLPTAHRNFAQRGTPCHYSLFHDNVSVQPPSAVQTESPYPRTLIVLDNNTFKAPDPTTDLAVGDFDGDGVDDVFVGTGATWWFSSGGQAEWRLLNRMPEHASSLRFGDFDGDGRTDVLALHGPLLQVSWAGTSPWSTIAATGAALSDIAIGDFDGDHRADIFVADGGEWTYASGGKKWTHLAYSPLRTAQLRFGDFTRDGKTDVLEVAGSEWRIVRGGGTGIPETLRPALTPTVDGLVVADFDGDGIADVARSNGGSWQLSRSGRGDWVTLRATSTPLATLPVGRFDGNASADVIVWDDRYFAIAPGGRNPLETPRRQDMR